MPTTPFYLRAKEVAKLLGVTERTVYAYDSILLPYRRNRRVKEYVPHEVEMLRHTQWLELARSQQDRLRKWPEWFRKRLDVDHSSKHQWSSVRTGTVAPEIGKLA